jgi:DNA repair exonuclease SbcCD nuclease subunit
MPAPSTKSAITAPGDDTTSILIVNDLHIADRPPLGRKESYQTDILMKMGEIARRCNDFDIDALIITGDVFHSKRPSQVSHRLVQILQEWCGSTITCPVYILPGNHDMGPAGLASLHEQPIGGLQHSAVLLRDCTAFTLGPYGQPQVLVVPRPYNRQRDMDPTYYQLTEMELEMIERMTTKSTLMIAHGSIIPPGQDRPYAHITADQIDLTGIDVLASGHIHENLGMHEVDNKIFVNFGAISRPSRTKDNLTRQPNICLITLTGNDPRLGVVRPVALNARPAEEVFVETIIDDASGAEVPDDVIEFAELLAQGMESEALPLEELIAKMPEVPNVDMDQLRALVTHYLNEAGV